MKNLNLKFLEFGKTPRIQVIVSEGWLKKTKKQKNKHLPVKISRNEQNSANCLYKNYMVRTYTYTYSISFNAVGDYLKVLAF